MVGSAEPPTAWRLEPEGKETGMAKYGLKWMDSDMHLCEPVDLWEAYIDPPYKQWVPRWSGVPGKDHPLRNRGALGVGPVGAPRLRSG